MGSLWDCGQEKASKKDNDDNDNEIETQIAWMPHGCMT